MRRTRLRTRHKTLPTSSAGPEAHREREVIVTAGASAPVLLSAAGEGSAGAPGTVEPGR
jgi:hypothetical protein